jgi:hypothetical protein
MASTSMVGLFTVTSILMVETGPSNAAPLSQKISATSTKNIRVTIEDEAGCDTDEQAETNC